MISFIKSFVLIVNVVSITTGFITSRGYWFISALSMRLPMACRYDRQDSESNGVGGADTELQ